MVKRMLPVHIESVLQIHFESFQGFFLTTLGRKFLRHYYRVVVSEPSAVKLVAVEGREMRGFVVGALNPSKFYSALLRRDWLKFALASIPAIIRRPSNLSRLLGALRRPGKAQRGPGVAELSSIAVRPMLQGRGIGKRLVTAFIEECRSRGATKIYLTTDAERNEHVNAFYNKLGFNAERIIRTPENRLMNEYWYDIQ